MKFKSSPCLNTECCAIFLPGLDNVTYFVDMSYSIFYQIFIVQYGNKEMHVGEILKVTDR